MPMLLCSFIIEIHILSACSPVTSYHQMPVCSTAW